MRRRAAPRPPERVRLIRADGEEIPVEVRYVGRKRGHYEWTSVLSYEHSPGDQVAIGVLPPKTSVSILYRWP